MNKRTLALVSLGLAGLGLAAWNHAPAVGQQDSKVLRHVVLFNFKDDLDAAQVQEVVDAFAALPGKISQIQGFEWGTDVSVENKAAGFTHGFMVSFKDAKARDQYLPHPAHQEFVKLVGPRLENVLVFDYITGQ